MDWLEDPDPRRGLRFAATDGSWPMVSYADLADRVRAAAGALRSEGVGPGDRVGLVFPTGPEFVTALFGVWAVRAVPCPVAPPGLVLRDAAYTAHLDGLARAVDMSALVVAGQYADAVSQAARARGIRVLHDLRGPAADVVARGPSNPALVQFSSGSTSRPKGIVIGSGALRHHLSAIADWLGVTRATPAANWAPLHHDMGLVGCLLTPMAQGADVWLMSPEHFLRRPVEWLRCLGEHGASKAVSTCFGLEHILRRVNPAALAGMDFTGWDALVIGAERIRPEVVARFGALLEPFGLRRSALMPAYGMAESTLAVTGSPRTEEPVHRHIDAASLRIGEPVRPLDAGKGGTPVMACGSPLSGTGVEVADIDGTPLPEGHLGEIRVSGRSLADGYAEGGALPGTAFTGGLTTGDVGFLAAGELYVMGRYGDSVKVHGRVVFAEDLELLVRSALPEVGSCVLLLGEDGGGAKAVALVQRIDPPRAAALTSLLLPHLPGVAVELRRTPPRAILRTTSGKPRRRPMWKQLSYGWSPGEVVEAAPAKSTMG
ncbi:AMP-binding protein [Streptomyces albus subsp. chlorinus]|uniref:AMP-binding protein n=1 Tax=Streptomyces albus TaxID=1888 RepID=UPI001FAB3F39|nr:AMP-binding protein [Streptomyces albus]